MMSAECRMIGRRARIRIPACQSPAFLIQHSSFSIQHSSYGTTRMPKADPTAAFDTFFTGIGAKDKLSIEKHLAAIDAEGDPGHGRAWRRLATTLRQLAPLSVQ